jgi:murein L,D-transpeptidase YafK
MKYVLFLSIIGWLAVWPTVSFAETSDLGTQTSNSEVPAALVQWSSETETSPYFIVVDKNQRQLTVWKSSASQFEKINQYPTDIGKLDGNKTKTGDFKTPEGIYFLTEKLSGQTLNFDLYGSLAFTTDYPNIFDRFDNKSGKGIWLHAIPDAVPLTRGSKGCVVVRNNVIHELEKYIQIGQTPIFIFDQIKTIQPETRSQLVTSIHDFVNTWKNNWVNKNLDEYMQFYHDNFRSSEMNKVAWKKHKTKLASSYQTINVSFSEPTILNHNNQWIIKMQQNYSSDKYSDMGLKTLYLIKENNSFKILAEDWQQIVGAAASINRQTANDKSL